MRVGYLLLVILYKGTLATYFKCFLHTFSYFCWGCSERKKIEEAQEKRVVGNQRNTWFTRSVWNYKKYILQTVKYTTLAWERHFSQPSRSFEEGCCWRSSLGSVLVIMVLMVLRPSDLGSVCMYIAALAELLSCLPFIRCLYTGKDWKKSSIYTSFREGAKWQII